MSFSVQHEISVVAIPYLEEVAYEGVRRQGLHECLPRFNHAVVEGEHKYFVQRLIPTVLLFQGGDRDRIWDQLDRPRVPRDQFHLVRPKPKRKTGSREDLLKLR